MTSTGWGRVSSSSGTRFAFGGEVSYTRNHTAHEESMEFYGPVEGELAIFVIRILESSIKLLGTKFQ